MLIGCDRMKRTGSGEREQENRIKRGEKEGKTG